MPWDHPIEHIRDVTGIGGNTHHVRSRHLERLRRKGPHQTDVWKTKYPQGTGSNKEFCGYHSPDQEYSVCRRKPCLFPKVGGIL